MTIETAHVTAEQAAKWRARTLEGEEALLVSDHAEGCAECRRALSGGRGADDIARAIDASLQPERAEMAELSRFGATLDAPEPWAAERRHRTRRVLFGSLSAAAALVILALVVRSRSDPQLRDGPLVVSKDGSVSGIAAEWRTGVAALARGGALEAPRNLREVLRPSEQQRSAATSPDPVRLEEPKSRVLLEDRPELRFSGPEGSLFRVAVYGPAFESLAVSEPLSARAWRPPPLPRGKPLTWNVTAIRDGAEKTYPEPPDPPAAFLIVTDEEAKAIAAARSTGSRLVYALALWRSGLVDEAREELATLAREHSASPLAARLASESAKASAANQ